MEQQLILPFHPFLVLIYRISTMFRLQGGYVDFTMTVMFYRIILPKYSLVLCEYHAAGKSFTGVIRVIVNIDIKTRGYNI